MRSGIRILMIGWLLLGAVLLSGQEVRREFRVLGYGESFFEGIRFERSGVANEEAVVELAFLANQKSRRYRISEADKVLSFYREEAGPKNTVKRVEVGKVRWPEKVEKGLLVFFERAGAEAEGTYEVMLLDESPAVWQAGGFRFLNLSGAELDCRMGDSVFKLPLDASEIVRFDPLTTGPMRLQLSVRWQGEDRIVYSTRTAPDKNHAKLLVIRPPAEEGSLRVEVENLW